MTDKFESLLACIERRKKEIEMQVLSEIRDAIKVRIHGDGLDSNGVKIGLKGGSKARKNAGEYSPGYARFKGKIVRNLYPINLFLNGDLSNALQILEVGDEIGLGLNPNTTYNDLTSAELAQVHEKNYNTTIYAPTEADVNKALELIAEPLLKDFISSCIKEAGLEQ